MKSPRNTSLAFLLLMLLSTSACSKAYYSAMERIGYHKRDLLKSRVEDAAETQDEAKEQFQDALERFAQVVQFDGGELQQKYDALKAEFEDSSAVADKLRNRIDAVDDVAEALFDEWEDELESYQSSQLRRDSERKLRATRRRYKPMITAMRRVEKKMDPVLAAFQDQVLYLKHNLNARAIASLGGEFNAVEADIQSLVREMEASIGEAEAFIATLQQG